MAKERKRAALNTKTTKSLRAALEAAAAESGRSLTGEIEYRLEMSLRDDYHDRRSAQVALYIAREVKSWYDKPKVPEEIRNNINEIRKAEELARCGSR